MRLVWTRRLFAAAALSGWGGGAYLGCSETERRPGPIADCTEAECRGRGPVGPLGATTGGDAGSGGAAGAAGGGGSPEPAAGTLAGSIAAVVEPDLTASRALDGLVQVRAAGATAAEVTTDAAQDGAFALAGVDPDPELWVGVGAFDGRADGPFVDTLQVVDATRGAALELLVLRRGVLEQIAANFLNNPLELDPARGHAILSFVDPRGAGLEGVTLIVPAPDEVSVAYDLGEVYSDQVEATSTRGTLVLLNLAAADYPGAVTAVATQVRGARYDVDLRIASGSVTLVTAIVPDP